MRISASLCLATFLLGSALDIGGQQVRPGSPAPQPGGMESYKASAQCPECQRLANVVAADQQELPRLKKACADAEAAYFASIQEEERAYNDSVAADRAHSSDAFQKGKAFDSARAAKENEYANKQRACAPYWARMQVLQADINALEACNRACRQKVVDPPPPPPPPKPPAPEPPAPPKPAKVAPRTMTHVTTNCGPCRDFADAANKNMDYCSAENDPQNCAAMDKWLQELAACEKKECAPTTDSVGAVRKPASPPNKPGQTPQQQPQLQRAPQTPAKQPAQQAVKPAAQPTSQPQSGQQLKLPPKQPTPQVVQPTQQQSGLKLPPKAPTQQGSQPVLQQQPNQQGVLKLPPKPLPAEETKQQKAGVITQPQ